LKGGAKWRRKQKNKITNRTHKSLEKVLKEKHGAFILRFLVDPLKKRIIIIITIIGDHYNDLQKAAASFHMPPIHQPDS